MAKLNELDRLEVITKKRAELEAEERELNAIKRRYGRILKAQRDIPDFQNFEDFADAVANLRERIKKTPDLANDLIDSLPTDSKKTKTTKAGGKRLRLTPEEKNAEIELFRKGATVDERVAAHGGKGRATLTALYKKVHPGDRRRK